MTQRSYNVISALGTRTLVTAESCTGGGIGAALTAVPGSSKVFKGGIISYTNEVKASQLNVDWEVLNTYGAVSSRVAREMAIGARENLKADFAVSVTGLAGPDGDEFGNPVGTVYIGFADSNCADVRKFLFSGDRESVRNQAVCAALDYILEKIQ